MAKEIVPETLTEGESQQRELIAMVWPGSFWRYEGTRAQLEAEGVIPPKFEWPTGKGRVAWESGQFKYWLQRTRPEGVKGPMSIWINGDWWVIHGRLADRQRSEKWEAELKRKRLIDELYAMTPNGKIEAEILGRKWWRSYRDSAFQAFKAKVLPSRKKPGRPRKVAA